MIGYYAHHHGAGHVNRALAIAEHLDDEVTILSSADRPTGWRGRWISLPRDTDLPPIDPLAHGALHWVPIGSTGLATRMAFISSWLLTVRPDVVVVDVSVEVAALVRLHGIRVVVVAQPGLRVDDAHTFGYRIADAIVGCWPAAVHPVRTINTAEVKTIGAISRIPVAERTGVKPRQLAVVNGSGGRAPSALDAVVAEAMPQLSGFEWVRLRGASQGEVASTLRESAVVFGHCGENVVAEIAASRAPAVLVPEDRPFDEQYFLATELAKINIPARVVMAGETVDWPQAVAGLAASDSTRWSAWVDGAAAERAARIIEWVAA